MDENETREEKEEIQLIPDMEEENPVQPAAPAQKMRHQYGPGAIVLTVVITLLVSMIVGILGYGYYQEKKAAESSQTDLSIEDKIAEVQSYIDNYFVGDVDQQQIEDSIIAGMIDGLGDRWSYYMTAEEYKSYQQTQANEYVGIGVTVSQLEDGYIEVTAVTEDGPAYEAGIVTGDILISVDGEDIAELGYTETVSVIKGEEGTTVDVGVQKTDGTQVVYTVERRVISTPSVSYEMMDGNIGYIRIKNFDDGTADLFCSAVDDLIADGAEGLIFDCRYNPGGHLDELLTMLDKILPEEPIFVSRTKEQKENGEQSVIMANEGEIDLPMVCLIGEYTYSAAEFFPAVLSEYGKATLIGTPTTGKGYAQTSFVLSDGSAINISIQEYFTPNGVSLAEQGGIDPDITVEMTAEQLANFQYSHEDDPVLDKALETLAEQIKQGS